MSSPTETTTSTSFASLNLVGSKTPPQSIHTKEESSQLPKPLTLSGALSKYPTEQLTPAVGLQFTKEFKLKTILSLPTTEKEAALRDLAILISQNGVVFLKDQNEITNEDLAEIGLALGTLVGVKNPGLSIHPTQELGENGLPVGKITNQVSKDGRNISFMDEVSNLSSNGWHSDISFEPRPAMYTILKMHTLPKTGGDTLWNSSYSVYDSLSPPFAKFLEGLTATHDAERFREQSRKHGFKLRTEARGVPENVGDAFQAVHPVVRTDLVTGHKSLYVNVTFTKRINELNVDESKALLDYLFLLQHQSHDVQVKYRWSKNDMALWDNAAVSHLATFDYSEPRAGDRVVCIGEKPYLDPNSTGRKEALKAQASA